MARRKRVDASPEVRALLAERWRNTAATYYDAVGVPAGDDPAGWLRRADALDAGEPVTAAGWEVARLISEVSPYDDEVRLEADGSVTVGRRAAGPICGA